jgi:hypothetical protein
MPMVDLEAQVVVDQELIIKQQPEDLEQLVKEMQVVEMLDPLELVHVKLDLVVAVELAQLQVILLEFKVLLVVLV